ncbi:MAG TPA: type II toxin-antitoxin system Phd/YefM family antitoxin [Patescibacteria group bacterium]|nr:type II toxin-antitoxin system Phd/YefM family antitoxin [Patescibacteria group bacterium]
MNTKNTLSITEARKRIFEIADAVQKPDCFYVLTEKGKPKAVIISAEEFESWKETLEVIEQFPDLDKDIAQAHNDYTEGNCIVFDEYLRGEGYMISDKGKKKYEISHSSIKKSKKKSTHN